MDESNGGIITTADFAAYQMKEREAVRSTYRGYDIGSFSPPGSGGVHVAEILKILENFDLAHLPEAIRIHVMGASDPRVPGEALGFNKIRRALPQ